MKHHDVMLISWELENKWLQLGRKVLLEYGTLPVPTFIAELAYLCDISILTSRRYLQKHSAPSGPLVVASGAVSLKADTDEPF